MKNLMKIFVLAVVFGFTFVSCGGSASKFAGKFSGEEYEAVKILDSQLPRGATIEECEVVKGKLPLALLETEYKSVRDQVFKARLDYRSCMTRGLTGPAEKNAAILVGVQNMLKEKSANLEASSPEYLFVLAKVKEPGSNRENPAGYIGVFDANSMENVDMIQVTTPLYNNAIMVEEALSDKLSDPNSTGEAGSVKSTNPVVEFILSCDPK